MSNHRTPWHPAFAFVLDRHRPPGVTVVPELVLTTEPQRADLLLLRRAAGDHLHGGILRGLWPLLPPHALLELKTVAAPPEPRAWVKLLGYGHQYDATRPEGLKEAAELALVMVTPSFTPTLLFDLERAGQPLLRMREGYYRVEGPMYPAYVVLLDEVSVAEDDPLLAIFAHHSARARLGAPPADEVEALVAYLGHLGVDVRDREGFEDVIKSALENIPPERLARIVASFPSEVRLAGLRPEERVAGLRPEERVAGLRPEERWLLLTDEELRQLPDALIASLPVEVQEAIRRRLQR